MNTLNIYSSEGCSKCEQAASLLDSMGIPYVKTDIYLDDFAMKDMRRDGLRSVPQIYLNGSLFVEGGFQGLQKMDPESIKFSLRCVDEIDAMGN